MKKKVAVILSLTVAMAFCLASCGSSFDASAYVKGSLDAIQTGTVSDELAGITEESKEDLQAQVDELRTETEKSLLDAMGDEQENLTDAAKASITSAVDGMFAKMKYEVGEEATKDGDDYTVAVKAYPMKCFGEFMDWMQGDFINDWMSKATSYTSQDKLMKDMYEDCFAKLDEFVQNTEYDDPQDMNIKVALNDDGVYEADTDNVEQLVSVLLGTTQLAGLSQ